MNGLESQNVPEPHKGGSAASVQGVTLKTSKFPQPPARAYLKLVSDHLSQCTKESLHHAEWVAKAV